MKRIYILLIAVFSLGMGGCNYVDVDPVGKVIPDEVSEYRALLTTAYSTYPQYRRYLMVRSDEVFPDLYGLSYDNYIDLATLNDENPDPLNTLMLTEPNIDPEDLKNITIPVLVTAGSNDVILKEHTELIADSLPNSELKIVDGEDHGSYIQDSDIMGKLLIDFLQEHDY